MCAPLTHYMSGPHAEDSAGAVRAGLVKCHGRGKTKEKLGIGHGLEHSIRPGAPQHCPLTEELNGSPKVRAGGSNTSQGLLCELRVVLKVDDQSTSLVFKPETCYASA